MKHIHVKDMVSTLIDRKKIEISHSNIISDLLLRYLVCCKKCKNKCMTSDALKRKRIYDKAETKLRHHFDIKNILRSSLLSDLMM